MPPSQTLAQQRASHAWKAVEAACKGHGAEDYAREAKRLPVRIMTSGLGQALSFLNAKSGDGRVRLANDLASWLIKGRGLGGRRGEADGKALILAITEGDADFLRRATEEAQLYLQWLTRFAEAEINTEDASDG